MRELTKKLGQRGSVPLLNSFTKPLRKRSTLSVLPPPLHEVIAPWFQRKGVVCIDAAGLVGIRQGKHHQREYRHPDRRNGTSLEEYGECSYMFSPPPCLAPISCIGIGGVCIRGLHFDLIMVAEGGHHIQICFSYLICNYDHNRCGLSIDHLASTSVKLHLSLFLMSGDAMLVKSISKISLNQTALKSSKSNVHSFSRNSW